MRKTRVNVKNNLYLFLDSGILIMLLTLAPLLEYVKATLAHYSSNFTVALA